jgi:hypothetical protein
MKSGTSEDYFWSAIEGEASIVASAAASTRNHVLNRAAFKLGSIPDMPTDTAIGALMRASGENGYVKEHGRSATLKVIESGFRNGQRNPRTLTSVRETTRRQPIAQNRVPMVGQVRVVASSKPILFPIATPPDEQGKPTFHQWEKDGPPVRSDEKRRHLFARDGEPVRIKVMQKKGGAANWYRVKNGDGAIGWQARKPQGFVEVPYVAGADPFDREIGQKARRMWIPSIALACWQSRLAAPGTDCRTDALHILPDAVSLSSLTMTKADVSMQNGRLPS